MIVPELGEKIIKMNGALFFFENSISAFIVNCELILKARFEKIYVKHFFRNLWTLKNKFSTISKL